MDYHNDFIAISGVSKTYPNTNTPAVRNISLSIRRGSIFGLLGPNGAGKTTLLSMFSGLLHQDSGSIVVDGLDTQDNMAAIKSRLGLVPQELALYPSLTAHENLAFFGSMQGLTGDTLQTRIDACLRLSKLEDRAHQRVNSYSGGLKRRLNLAVGLIHQPQLLILDEPTVGIDPQSRNFIYDSLTHLNQAGMTIIYTTHYMEEVEQLCDDIAIMDQGQVIASGTLDELLAHGTTDNTSHSIHLRTEQDIPDVIIETLRQHKSVEQLNSNARSLHISSHNAEQTLHDTLELFRRKSITLRSINYGAANLEQLFLQLTGASLRD